MLSEDEKLIFSDGERTIFNDGEKTIFNEVQRKMFGALDRTVFGEVERTVFGEVNKTVFTETKKPVFTETITPVFTEHITPVFTETAIADPSKVKVLLTIVGESASIDGIFKVSNSLEIDCEVKGVLEVDGKLKIQKNGRVNADVTTVDAEIIGKYEGNMVASGTVIINETGVLSGNVRTDSLIINKGGVFSGTVVRINELSDDKSIIMLKKVFALEEAKKKSQVVSVLVNPLLKNAVSGNNGGKNNGGNNNGGKNNGGKSSANVLLYQ